MEISYKNTEEKYIDLLLKDIFRSRKNKLKIFGLSLFVAIIFAALCISRYSYDMEFYGFLKEESSFALLVYIICGILWAILLPVIAWKLRSISIMKEINNMQIPFEGDVKYILGEEDIIVENNFKSIKSKLSMVKSIEDKHKYIELIIINYDRFLIPIDAFKDENEKNEFINIIKEKSQKESEVE
ncbi:MAG: hypothetical protein GX275_07775 [Clostridiales bacterium]|nr:hypothetical protein [Clostridiales bacterium]